MLTTCHAGNRELPTLAYLDDVQANTPERLPVLEDTGTVTFGSDMDESHYTDELGNRLSPRKCDILEKAVKLARARLLRDSESFWKNEEFRDVVEEVLPEIQQPGTFMDVRNSTYNNWNHYLRLSTR